MGINLDVNRVSELISQKLEAWIEIAISTIPNFLAATLIICVFALIGTIASKIVRKLLPKASSNVAVISIVSTVAKIVILLIGLFIALGVLNLDKTVTSLLAGAGVIGIALGFAFQEIASNFVSGVLIAFREPYRVGDIVEVDNYLGKVTVINLRSTVIKTFDGLNVYVPNKTMFTQALINYTTTVERRLELRVGVSYADDLEKAEQLIKQACDKTPGRIKDKEIEVYYEEFGSSSINMLVFIWIQYPGDNHYLRARHHAVINIKKIFDENDITIPFPIRTLDFGIKGGETLTEQMKEHPGLMEKIA